MNPNLINYAIGATTFSGTKNNLVATSAPTATNDSSQGYGPGSVWIDTVANKIYIATSVAPGAANWVATTGTIPTTQNKFNATSAPVATNDSSQGYSVGSHWIDITNDIVYVCVDSTAAAAVWQEVSNAGNAKVGIATVAPASSDNLSGGYATSSMWVDTTAKKVYVCVSSTSTSAVWQEITNSSTPLSNLSSTTNPTQTNDSSTTQNYSVGSIWVNVTTNESFICVDSSIGAAIWKSTSNALSNLTATAKPTASNDSTQGYSPSSVWIDTTNNDVYICISSTASNAIWLLITPEVNNNLSATTAPTAANDSSAGYDVGSHWVNTTTQKAYICTSNTVANAVWSEITQITKHNINSANIAPGAGNDSSQGYSVGSLWVDTTVDAAYICVDATASSAVWVGIGSTTTVTGQATPLLIRTTTNPTANDDINDGFYEGAIWVNTAANTAYICISNLPSLAQWQPIGSGSGSGTTTSSNNFSATTNPTAADASPTYSVGSLWINTTSDTGFICVDATTAAAVWISITGGSIVNNYTATTAPTATNSAPTYSVGSVWVDTTADKAYLCVDSTATAAIWAEVSSISNNYAATTAPTATNSAPTYSVGSVWIDTTADKSYTCVDSTASAAVWVETSPAASSNIATVDPTAANDSSQGYSVGSLWVNTTSNHSFICVDATNTSAIWNKIDAVVTHNLVATVNPTAANDNTQGFVIGSLWLNTTSQQLFICSSAVTGTAVWVAPSIKHNMTATTAPTTTADANSGYSISSMWLETTATATNLYMCTKNTVGAAVWLQVTSSSEAVNNLAAVIAPTTANDNTQGYSVSSHWYNTATKDLYICTSAATNAATWVLVTDQRVNNFSATANPTTTNDSSSFYEVGSFWYVASTSSMFVCADATAGAAKWIAISSIKDNLTATTAPIATNDSSSGYSVGSTWVDVTNDKAYICVDATATSAIWHQIDESIKYNMTATIAPTTTDNASTGYSVNSMWYNATLQDLYICTAATSTTATWVAVSNEIKNNFAATTAPIVSNDFSQGYEVGSMWIDTTANKVYTCVDSTNGAAIWIEQNATILYNLTATSNPVVTSDANSGYSVNSMWFNNVTRDLFICTSAAAGAATWVVVSNEVKDNYNAATDPTTTDDASVGYSLGSAWINNTTKESFQCVDATNGAAVWKSQTAPAGKSSTFDTITITTTISSGTAIPVPSVNLGATAAEFNGNTVVVLLNGFEQTKGTGVSWSSASSITLSTTVYAGDIITVKP